MSTHEPLVPHLSHPVHVPPRVKITSLSGLISLTPYLVGFTPAESLVFVFTGGQPLLIKVTLRIDLMADEEWHEHGQALMSHVATALDRARGSGVDLAAAHLLVFSGDASALPARPMVEAAADMCRVRSIEVAGALAVSGDTCWFFDCTRQCCRPGGSGHRLDENETLSATFAMVASGVSYAPSRDALEDAVAPPHGDAPRIDEEALRAVARRRTSPRSDRLASSAWRRSQEDAIVAAADQPCSLDEVRRRGAEWAVALADSRVREPVLRRLLLAGPRHERAARMARARDWLTALVGMLDGPAAAPVAATLAAVSWQGGDGAFARIAAERALAADADNRLAILIATACASGLPPSTWTDVLGEFSLDELRHPVGADSLAS